MQLLLGLGGNIGDVHSRFREVVAAMRLRGCLLAVSSLYRSRPLGPPQAEFTNAVMLVELDEPISHFLGACQAQETAAGRDRRREPRWGPRTLDLDLLLAPHLVCRGPELELPHPRLAERAFALVPAAELRPDWVHPIVGKSLSELADELMRRDSEAVRRFAELGG